jgi:hypothetical protein
MDLDEVVTKLNERKQRATYGAVGDIVGKLPLGLMGGLPRNQKYSWVVAKRNSRRKGAVRGSPTGYTDDQIHPDCLRQIRDGSGDIIEDSETLAQWLKS